MRGFEQLAGTGSGWLYRVRAGFRKEYCHGSRPAADPFLDTERRSQHHGGLPGRLAGRDLPNRRCPERLARDVARQRKRLVGLYLDQRTASYWRDFGSGLDTAKCAGGFVRAISFGLCGMREQSCFPGVRPVCGRQHIYGGRPGRLWVLYETGYPRH